MKIECLRSELLIKPETEQDNAYLEDTIGFAEKKILVTIKGVYVTGYTGKKYLAHITLTKGNTT